jgi:hypothetical protein
MRSQSQDGQCGQGQGLMTPCKGHRRTGAGRDPETAGAGTGAGWGPAPVEDYPTSSVFAYNANFCVCQGCRPAAAGAPVPPSPSARGRGGRPLHTRGTRCTYRRVAVRKSLVGQTSILSAHAHPPRAPPRHSKSSDDIATELRRLHTLDNFPATHVDCDGHTLNHNYRSKHA